MAQAALAYQQPARRTRYDQWPEHRPEQRPQRQLQVLPGKGRDAQNQKALSPTWRRLFTAAIIAVFVIGAVWLVRVGLTEATMAMLANSDQVAESIASERLVASQLEFEYSKASSPLSVQDTAQNQLGMAVDEQVEYLRVLASE
jgi:hypothetical protein